MSTSFEEEERGREGRREGGTYMCGGGQLLGEKLQ